MNRRRRAFVAALLSSPSTFVRAWAGEDDATRRVLHVGPHRAIKRIRDVVRQVRDGDIVEIDAGDYVGDVAVWRQSNLVIRGVAGLSRLVASGHSAEGKAIFVVRGDAVTIENLTFSGARVPSRNGAGIRHETGRLRVRDCIFVGNEEGLLTGNDADAELAIEGCEFGHNGAGDGQTHDLYVGSIAKLFVTESYFHHANVGHLFKSRALESFVFYNRLTDEAGGRASYELEFPSGGGAYVIGNIIGQSATTRNPIVVRYGAEAYRAQGNELFLVNNTLVNDRRGDAFALVVRPGAQRIKAFDNLFVDLAPIHGLAIESAANLRVGREDFADIARFDCRLHRSSDAMGRAVLPGRANGHDLRPSREYVHPRQSRPIDARIYSPGAIQTISS